MRKTITFPAHCFSFLLFCTSKTDVYLSRISSALFSCYSVLAPFYSDSLLAGHISPLIDGESGRGKKVFVLERIDCIIVFIIIIIIIIIIAIIIIIIIIAIIIIIIIAIIIITTIIVIVIIIILSSFSIIVIIQYYWIINLSQL